MMHPIVGRGVVRRSARRLTLLAGCLVVLWALLLSACSGAQNPLPATAMSVAATATHTATLAPTPTPVPTVTSLPTATHTAISTPTPICTPTPTTTSTATATPTPTHPMMIESMREQAYPGSDIIIEQTLTPGANYDRYIASYLSEGLTIHALLTVPRGEKPASGWPVIVLNHGYIPPEEYRTAKRYVAYVDRFARNGYVVIASDYRGHGDSEGEPISGNRAPDYTVDVLNAMASAQRHPDVDPERVGMWGHSMGGGIILRAMVVSEEIKAGVIWAGTVAAYPTLLEDLDRRFEERLTLTPGGVPAWSRWGEDMLQTYGSPAENPGFWEAISPLTYLEDLSGPLQLHHGTADETVPLEYSTELCTRLEEMGKPAELLLYEDDDHNISRNLSAALQRSLAFFDAHVKGAGD